MEGLFHFGSGELEKQAFELSMLAKYIQPTETSIYVGSTSILGSLEEARGLHEQSQAKVSSVKNNLITDLKQLNNQEPNLDVNKITSNLHKDFGSKIPEAIKDQISPSILESLSEAQKSNSNSRMQVRQAINHLSNLLEKLSENDWKNMIYEDKN